MLTSNPVVRTHQHQTLLLALPFIIFLYPAIALLAAKSTIPVYLHRYSWNLLIFNVLNIAAYSAFVLGIRTGWATVQFGATAFLAVLSLVVLSNNSLLDLPAIVTMVQLARLIAGFALLIIALRADKRGRKLTARFSIVLGTLFTLTALLDLSWSVVASVRPTDRTKQVYSSYRTSYDLTRVTDRDIILVGDSFVWGAGVPLEQRFGDVLERRLKTSGSQSRIFSLGLVGANVPGYIRQLQDVPPFARARQVIVFFYANDMPPRSNLQDTLQQLAVSLGRGSVTTRTLVDLARIAVTPNPDEYASLLLSHFDEKDRTFPVRWRQLERELNDFFQLAKSRSHDQPALVLLPMLTDFQKAAFDEPLHRVGQVAERIGFRVIDTMPAFRADGGAANAYRAAPNDLHLNERGNKIIADVLVGLVTK